MGHEKFDPAKLEKLNDPARLARRNGSAPSGVDYRPGTSLPSVVRA